jgi:putative restriction endonuclease
MAASPSSSDRYAELPRRQAFLEHLVRETPDGSNRAKSYVRALDLLGQMIERVPLGFGDCAEVWGEGAIDPHRLHALLERVREEQQKGRLSAWNLEGIAPSYLQNGFCAAALRAYRLFLLEFAHTEAALELFEAHAGPEEALPAKLQAHVLHIPDAWLSDLEGTDAVREVRVRTNQQVFRAMILRIYRARCCVTGLDIPEVNRASHIVSWAQHKEARMDPRNGLCLSATYDAAFDRHLITLDETYRLVLSREIRDHYTSDSVREHFVRKEGQSIELPPRYLPSQSYLAQHRARCAI